MKQHIDGVTDKQAVEEFIEATKPEDAQVETEPLAEAQRRWGLTGWAYRVRNKDELKRCTVGYGFLLKGFGRTFFDAFKMAERLSTPAERKRWKFGSGSFDAK